MAPHWATTPEGSRALEMLSKGPVGLRLIMQSCFRSLRIQGSCLIVVTAFVTSGS